MGIKQLYNDNLRKLPNEYGDVSVMVRFLFVFDLLFSLFRIALWPSVGKELSLWPFTCAVFILVPS